MRTFFPMFHFMKKGSGKPPFSMYSFRYPLAAAFSSVPRKLSLMFLNLRYSLKERGYTSNVIFLPVKILA